MSSIIRLAHFIWCYTCRRGIRQQGCFAQIVYAVGRIVILVAVTSGKGGTGKSCVAAYTGVALSVGGKKTLIVEMGKDSRSIDIITAAQNDSAFDLGDVLAERCDPLEAATAASFTDKLSIIPAPCGKYQKADSAQLKEIIKKLRHEFDYILVDGVDFDVLPPKFFDHIIVVTTPDTLSVRACREQVASFYGSGAESVRLVINKVPPQIIPIHGAKDFDDVIDIIGAQLIAVVPESPKLHFSANNSQMLDQESATIQVFDNLAARLRGQSRPLLIR